MVDRPVNFIIDVEGGGEAQQAFEDIKISEQQAAETTRKLTSALKKLQDAEGDNAQAISRMRREVIRATQAQKKLREEATAASVKSLDFAQKATQLGSTIGQVGAVLSRVNPEMGRFGAVIGGVGAQIPALTGALGPVAQVVGAITVAVDLGTAAFELLNPQLDDAEEGFDAIASAAERAAEQLTAAAEAFRTVNREQNLLSGLAGTADLETEISRVRDGIAGLEAQRERHVAIIRESAEAAGQTVEQVTSVIRNAGGLADAQMTEAVEQVDSLSASMAQAQVRLEQLTEARSVAEAATAAEAEGTGRATVTPEEVVPGGRTRTRGRGRGGGGDRIAAAQQRADEALRRGLEQTARFERDLDTETDRLKELRHQEELRREAAELVAITERAAAEEVASNNAKRAQEELLQVTLQRQEEAANAARDAAEDLKSDVEGSIGPMLSGFTDALGNVIAGAESADDAFQGLLASFLEMLAQQAALEAAKEFASAIGSFASQDYASGALHLAAGAAWTVVAVAAGAGSVAARPAEAVPSSPESAADGGGGGGGGTQVFNINGTVISADGPGARARAGREVGALVGEGNRRFGRAG